MFASCLVRSSSIEVTGHVCAPPLAETSFIFEKTSNESKYNLKFYKFTVNNGSRVRYEWHILVYHDCLTCFLNRHHSGNHLLRRYSKVASTTSVRTCYAIYFLSLLRQFSLLSAELPARETFSSSDFSHLLFRISQSHFCM